jgi:C-terminal processing protease CtpA/Prc
MILEKTSESFQEEKFNMSGILVRKVKEYYKIFGLIKDSPAVEAGLEVDDILLKINGVSANEFSSEQIQEKFKTDGKLNLEIKRDDKILKKELKLRKLI